MPDWSDLAADAPEAVAFGRHFEAHFEELYRYVYRYVRSPEEARDLVHDVFLQLWQGRGQVDLARNLRAYLYAMARHRALDRLKHRKVEERWRRTVDASAGRRERGIAPGDPEQTLLEGELIAEVRAAVDALPRRQREVLRLRWDRQLSYEEISRTLGISPKTVGIHVGRALRAVRERLRGLADFPAE